MRYFLIILLGLLPFFATAQDTVVTIKPSTARYFLESDDQRNLLLKKDSISNQIIYEQEQVIDNKDSIIYTYQQDSIICESRATSYEQHIAYVRTELIKKDKEIKKQKLIKWGVMGLAILALFL